jgi:hypothetical protein
MWVVQGDTAAGELLRQVADQWTANGPLGVLRDLVRQVWRTDVNRFERALGDDAQCLGIQASRNLCNLAVKELSGRPGVVARDCKTLEVRFGGRILHTGKAPSGSPDWDVQSVDWSSSDVRDDAARANTVAYQPTEGTLFEGLPPLPGQVIDPTALALLHLTWQGFDDGSSRAWLGFPCLGERAWFAVMPLDGAGGGSGRARPQVTGPAGSAPDFAALREPDVHVARRPRPDSQPGAHGAGG